MKNKERIVGGLGSGKTTLIREKLIPLLKDYVVLDFCDEYRLHVKNSSNAIYFNGLVGWLLKGEVISAINKLSDDATVIIDNAHLLYFPTSQYSFVQDRGFEWLMDLLKNKHSVLVFQNTKQIANKGIYRNYNLRHIDHFNNSKIIKQLK